MQFFLDLDITIDDNIFVYKLFDKRDKFHFFTVRIPLSIFCGSIFSEFLRIAQCTLRLKDCLRKASQFYTRMITQGGNKSSILRQIKKSIPNIP